MEIDLGRVLDALPAMVWTALPDGHIDFVNRRWSEYTGLSLDEAHGWDWQAAVDPDDLPKLRERWRSILASGEPGELEARVRRFDGQYRWYLVHCNPMSDDAGRIVKWCGTATDVDDFRRAGENLRRRELDFQLIVDSIPIPVAVTTPSGEVEGLNQLTLDYFGKTFEELKGWKASEVVHPDDLERTIAAQLEAHLQGHSYNVESRHRRADGVYRWYNVLGLPLRDPQGNILRWFHLLIDIDDRRRAEEALRQSEARLADAERDLQLTIDTIPVFVATYQPDGTRTSVNRIWQDYVGLTLEQATGAIATTFPYFHPADIERNDKAWRASLASGQPLSIEVRMRRADGQYRWHIMRRVPLRDRKGDIVRWYSVGVDIEDQKRAEEALRARERDLGLIINTIPVMAWSARPDGSAEFFNQHYLNYVGLSVGQSDDWDLTAAVSRYWDLTAAVHPADVERNDKAWRASLASGQPLSIEVRVRRADGQYRWHTIRRVPFGNEKGDIVQWYAVGVDIEDQKQAEERLRRSEARKAAILDSALDCIVTIDHDGRITEFNPAAERTFGYRRDEVVGEHLADIIIPPSLRENHTQGLARYLATGETRVLGRRIEMMAVRADGVEFAVELAITRIPLDGPPSFTGYLRDITARKQAEEQLRRSEAFLAEGQRLSLTGSFSWRLETDEITWSEQLYRIFEFDQGMPVTLELIGTRVHPEDIPLFNDMIDRARGARGDFDYEYRLQMPDNSIKYLHMVAHGTRNQDGQTEYVGALQDVTERRLADEALGRLRSELAHVARVTSLGALTASIAHEVNQPLSGIITNASTCLRMLAADPPNVEGARETARRTIRDGNRAADVISRLRELFSKRTATIEPVDINETAHEVIALASGDLQRSRVVLRTELDKELPPVAGDRVQLQQVILNLLRNASDAMSGVEDRPRQLVIRTEPDEGDRVRLSVQDAGVGFDPQSAGRLFEAFYTTKSDGMGMGLSVSRSIIESHHGRLWAAPNDGPGVTFAFSIPCEPELATGAHRLGVTTPAMTDAQHVIRNP